MKQTFTLQINVTPHTFEAEADVPLLWIIREHLQLTGTKFGCGISQCGACTVHVDGRPMRSCQLPASRVVGREITTIEGIAADHPVKNAWIDIQAPQCGYCQSGQIMQAASFLELNPEPTDDQIDAAMSGNLCRCGTYPRIRAAVHSAAARLRGA